MVAQDHTQDIFEDLQEWRMHNLCRQAMQVTDQSPSSTKLFPDVQRESPVVPIHSGPVTEHHWRKPLSVLFTPSLQAFVYIDGISPKGCLLQDEQSGCLWLSSQMRCSWPLMTFVALQHRLSSMSMSCVTYSLYEKFSSFLVYSHI